MIHARTLLIAGLCALGAPMLLPATAQAQTAMFRPRAMGGGPNVDRPAWVRFPIHTAVSEHAGRNCLYTARADGTYRAPPGGNQPGTEVRDATVHGTSSLECNGRVVERRDAHIAAPLTSTDALGALVRDRLALVVPETGCAAAPHVAIGGVRLSDRAHDGCATHASAIVERRDKPPIAQGGGPLPGVVWHFDRVERRLSNERRAITSGHWVGYQDGPRGGGPGLASDQPARSDDARSGLQ